MSLEQCKEIAKVLFQHEPAMSKRFKEVITELYEEGFHEERLGDLYEAFVLGWIDHTRPKMTQVDREERQRFMDEAAGM